MPINSTHRLYDAASIYWRRCRDFYEGEDAVKSRGIDYLRPLDGQSSASPEYAAYKDRAMFYPATERTVAGLGGLIMRRPPTVAVPSQLEPQMKDLTLTLDDVEAVASSVVTELLIVGRVGVMIDWRGADDVLKGRAYWTVYRTEDIINWHEVVVSGRRMLTHLVLREWRTERSAKDSFTTESCEIFREYVLTAEGLEVREWRQVDAAGKKEWLIVETAFPVRRGRRLGVIPFVCCNVRAMGVTPEKPPLLDLVNVNMSHFRNSADHEHGLHYVALPTPYVIGYGMQPSMTLPADLMPESGAGATMAPTPPPKPALHIGAGTAWQIPNEKATVGMLEFQGAGLAALVSSMERKEKLMATLGARILDQTHRFAETAEAVRTKQSATTSSLQMLAATASLLMTTALKFHAWWTSTSEISQDDDTVSVKLNRDFFDSKLTSQEIAELVKLWQEGGICHDTLYWNLQQGEIARPDVDAEEEREAIKIEEDLREPDDPADPENPDGNEDVDPESEDDAVDKAAPTPAKGAVKKGGKK